MNETPYKKKTKDDDFEIQKTQGLSVVQRYFEMYDIWHNIPILFNPGEIMENYYESRGLD